jgi:hypothetical protein
VNIHGAVTVYKNSKNTTMKTNQTIKTVFIAAVAAVAALCGTVRPVQADLTGPKPPKLTHGLPTHETVSPVTGETR